MKNDHVEILGITPACDFPECLALCSSVEICETDKLCIPCIKPDIESILQVKVHLLLTSKKTICTPVGEKIIVDGVKRIRIMYVADEPCQPVHSAQFDIPFCFYILLKEPHDKVVDVYTAIEHISICQLNCRCFNISIIIFACAVNNKQYYHEADVGYNLNYKPYDNCEQTYDCKSHYGCCDCKPHHNCKLYYVCHDCKPDCKSHHNYNDCKPCHQDKLVHSFKKHFNHISSIWNAAR